MKLYSEADQLILKAQHDDPFFKYLTHKLLQFVKNGRGKKAIDLGCGTGRNVIALARLGYSTLGVELSEKAVEIGKKKIRDERLEGKARLISDDIFNIKKHRIGLFDVCIMSEVIEHLEDYQKGLDLAYSLLKPGGMLLLTTPHDPKQWTVLDDYAGHVKRFTKPELEKGLSLYREVYVFTVGFPTRRIIFTIYNFLCKWRKKSHQPKLFRYNSLVSLIYSGLGSLFIRFDDLFNFLSLGETFVAVSKK